MQDLNALIPFLVSHTRCVRIISGFDPEKSCVSGAKPGDSIFEGIERAKAPRPQEHISMGLFVIEVETREYDNQRFTDTTIEGAAQRAVDWVRERLLDESG